MQNQFFGEHIGALHSRNCDQASEDVAGAWNNSQTVFLALGAKYGYGIDFFISKEWEWLSSSYDSRRDQWCNLGFKITLEICSPFFIKFIET